MTTQAPALTSHPFLTPEFLRAKFDAALPFERYITTGKPDHEEKWREFYGKVALTPEQATLIGAFTREMKVLVSSGTWCGDCVQQCPIMQKIAEASDGRIDLRFVDRDEHADLAEKLILSAAMRVPTVVFMAEDFELVGVFGDRVLSRYRAVAAKQLGAHCPLPGAPVPPEQVAAETKDWVDQFERIALLLRLSPRLREKHGD